jgi:hypothetical protein
VLGAKDSRRGNGDPIDVDWPAALREERWDSHRLAVEEARNRVLEEMATTEGLTPEADRQLRHAVSSLNTAFVAYRSAWFEQPRDPATRGPEYHRIWLGLRHIRKLIGSVYFVTDAKNNYELSRREEFRGGNVEEFLAYMTRNNLQFGTPTKDGDRDAYHQVFSLMARYYLDQSAMTKLQQRLEEEIDALKTVSEESVKVALGQTMSEADRVALTIAEMKFLSDLLGD